MVRNLIYSQSTLSTKLNIHENFTSKRGIVNLPDFLRKITVNLNQIIELRPFPDRKHSMPQNDNI